MKLNMLGLEEEICDAEDVNDMLRYAFPRNILSNLYSNISQQKNCISCQEIVDGVKS